MSSRRAVPLTFLRRLVLPPKNSAKSCICHRSEEFVRKSFACHTSENGLPQVLYLPHLRDPPGGIPSPVLSTQNGLLALSFPKPKTYNPNENLLPKDEKQLLLL